MSRRNETRWHIGCGGRFILDDDCFRCSVCQQLQTTETAFSYAEMKLAEQFRAELEKRGCMVLIMYPSNLNGVEPRTLQAKLYGHALAYDSRINNG